MNIFIRLGEGKPIHISHSSGSTRCRPARYDTSEWEVVDLLEGRADQLCKSCMSSPKEEDSLEEFYERRSKYRQHKAAIGRASTHKK